MEITELKLEYETVEKKTDGIPVIIAAAGVASRMGGTDKQLMSLLGIPVIVRTLKRFELSDDISRIIIVTKPESINKMQLLAEKYMISKVTDIVEGGSSRQESVMRGMERLAETEKKVLIHDGARPFVSSKMISDCVAALSEADCVLCAQKINDTVKLCDENGRVTATLDRRCLFSAQTPQGVDAKLYKEACDTAENLSAFTDDASIMEAAGLYVKIVAGSAENIKITSPEDIALAEAIIKGEEICE